MPTKFHVDSWQSDVNEDHPRRIVNDLHAGFSRSPDHKIDKVFPHVTCFREHNRKQLVGCCGAWVRQTLQFITQHLGMRKTWGSLRSSGRIFWNHVVTLTVDRGQIKLALGHVRRLPISLQRVTTQPIRRLTRLVFEVEEGRWGVLMCPQTARYSAVELPPRVYWSNALKLNLNYRAMIDIVSRDMSVG